MIVTHDDDGDSTMVTRTTDLTEALDWMKAHEGEALHISRKGWFANRAARFLRGAYEWLPDPKYGFKSWMPDLSRPHEYACEIPIPAPIRVCGRDLEGADPAWHRSYGAARFRVSRIGEHKFEGGASIGPVAFTPVTAATAEECAHELTLRVRDFARTIVELADETRPK